MKIGEIIENLIFIKDHNDLSRNERESINEACNVLEHYFNLQSDSYDLREVKAERLIVAKVNCGDVTAIIDKGEKFRFVRQLCWYNDAIGNAITNALDGDYDDEDNENKFTLNGEDDNDEEV